jgi:hypothetical protein
MDYQTFIKHDFLTFNILIYVIFVIISGDLKHELPYFNGSSLGSQQCSRTG